MSTDDHPVANKRSWTAFMPRPSSSGGTSSTPSYASMKRPSSANGMRSKEPSQPALPAPPEGQELVFSESSLFSPISPLISPAPTRPAHSGRSRPSTADPLSPSGSRPSTPKRWSSSFLLTNSSPKTSPQALDGQASQLILNALERTNSQQQSQSSFKSPTESTRNGGGSFGKSLSSMMGGLSNLSLSRTSTRDSTIVQEEKEKDKDRGRSMLKLGRMRSASQAPGEVQDDSRSSLSRARSQSPFTLRRFRTRDPSPAPQPVRMSQSDVELSDTSSAILPHTAFTDDESGDEGGTETDDESPDEEDVFDPITEANTERNALIPPVPTEGSGPGQEIEDPDPVGEGVNVIVAPEPYFPSSLNALGSAGRGKRNPRRRKSVRTHEPLPFTTSRPVFQRDRCTITLVQGDPEGTVGDRRKRRYVVASDLSEESRYAVEWGIGTVLRDGDDMLIVTVVENESKVDPTIPSAADRAVKLRSQQERQGLAYILVRQVTGLLQRTKLNVTISCQAWHAKNSRHMLLDIVDHVEPTMLIVGSRGLGQLNGILLGSTSHYLIQKCSVPVMVARRRLKRPPRKNAHLSTHRTHVSLAEAGIDRVAAKVDQDVQVMRDALQAEDERREGGGGGGPGSRPDARFEGVPENEGPEEEDGEEENDDEPVGVKVAG